MGLCVYMLKKSVVMYTGRKEPRIGQHEPCSKRAHVAWRVNKLDELDELFSRRLASHGTTPYMLARRDSIYRAVHFKLAKILDTLHLPRHSRSGCQSARS